MWSVPVDLSATTPAWPEQLTFRAAPLFVVHGANDPRVPLGEAEQIVAAVRARGLPVEYLVFPDEGHGLGRRANRLVAYPAIARFLDEHLLSRAAR